MTLLFPAYPWKNRNPHTQSAVKGCVNIMTIRSSVKYIAQPSLRGHHEKKPIGPDRAHRDRDRAATDRGSCFGFLKTLLCIRYCNQRRNNSAQMTTFSFLLRWERGRFLLPWPERAALSLREGTLSCNFN